MHGVYMQHCHKEKGKLSDRNDDKQYDTAVKFLAIEMGTMAKQKAIEEAPLQLTSQEKNLAIKRFNSLDQDGKGHITINDLRKHFKEHGEKIDERLLHELLNEVDLNKNGEIELMEFLQLYSGLKGGSVSHSRLARYLDSAEPHLKITPDRSGERENDLNGKWRNIMHKEHVASDCKFVCVTGMTNRRNPHAVANGRYGLIGGCGIRISAA
uniref:EF-hand domain-containing protein n=1 Tax=Romanomermis culicivorax TaxID=13658 RepID=A0A915KET0_ROMCU